MWLLSLILVAPPSPGGVCRNNCLLVAVLGVSMAILMSTSVNNSTTKKLRMKSSDMMNHLSIMNLSTPVFPPFWQKIPSFRRLYNEENTPLAALLIDTNPDIVPTGEIRYQPTKSTYLFPTLTACSVRLYKIVYLWCSQVTLENWSTPNSSHKLFFFICKINKLIFLSWLWNLTMSIWIQVCQFSYFIWL